MTGSDIPSSIDEEVYTDGVYGTEARIEEHGFELMY